MNNHPMDPTAVSPLEDRAARLFAVYGGPDAQAAGDRREQDAAARMRRARMAVQELEAFAAPLVTDHRGRQL
jgi:hypothetical protein